jgi:hypothetical protein
MVFAAFAHMGGVGNKIFSVSIPNRVLKFFQPLGSGKFDIRFSKFSCLNAIYHLNDRPVNPAKFKIELTIACC